MSEQCASFEPGLSQVCAKFEPGLNQVWARFEPDLSQLLASFELAVCDSVGISWKIFQNWRQVCIYKIIFNVGKY